MHNDAANLRKLSPIYDNKMNMIEERANRFNPAKMPVKSIFTYKLGVAWI